MRSSAHQADLFFCSAFPCSKLVTAQTREGSLEICHQQHQDGFTTFTDRSSRFQNLFLPAVFLGLLLNILDGVSYGMILFPSGAIFDGFGPMGMSLFFVMCVLSPFGPSLILAAIVGQLSRNSYSHSVVAILQAETVV